MRVLLFILTTFMVLSFKAQANSQSMNDVSIDESLQIQKKIEDEYKKLRTDPKTVAWELFGPRERINYTCREVCWCISRRFYDAINSPKAYQVNVSSRGGFFVKTRYESKVWYMFHVVLAVEFSKDNIQVVDPLVYFDTNFHPIEEWKQRFSNSEIISFKSFSK